MCVCIMLVRFYVHLLIHETFRDLVLFQIFILDFRLSQGSKLNLDFLIGDSDLAAMPKLAGVREIGLRTREWCVFNRE